MGGPRDRLAGMYWVKSVADSDPRSKVRSDVPFREWLVPVVQRQRCCDGGRCYWDRALDARPLSTWLRAEEVAPKANRRSAFQAAGSHAAVDALARGQNAAYPSAVRPLVRRGGRWMRKWFALGSD